jgi:hypothetical protein
MDGTGAPEGPEPTLPVREEAIMAKRVEVAEERIPARLRKLAGRAVAERGFWQKCSACGGGGKASYDQLTPDGAQMVHVGCQPEGFVPLGPWMNVEGYTQKKWHDAETTRPSQEATA